MYNDGTQWYIGYGTSCKEGEYPDGISKENAEQLLFKVLEGFEASVNSFIERNGLELTQSGLRRAGELYIIWGRAGSVPPTGFADI
jgi:hypothetical protein